MNGLSSLLLLSTLAAAPAPATPPEDGTYKQLELFARVLSYVENNYVEKVDQQQLIYGAIQGMLETLDPHTVFMPPEVFKEMKIDTSGEFGGLGMESRVKRDASWWWRPIDDTPAARAGIQPGDEILAIDGESTAGMDVARALAEDARPGGPAGDAHPHARGVQRAARNRHPPRPRAHRLGGGRALRRHRLGAR